MQTTYGLEQARAKIPLIAAQACAGYTSVITKHGEPVAAVVPVSFLLAQQAGRLRRGGILTLRGTERHLWPAGAV